jgi:hypothetical protein
VALATHGLDDFQAVVDAHPVDLAGRCVRYEVRGCAWSRCVALHGFATWHALLQRRPGETRQELVGAAGQPITYSAGGCMISMFALMGTGLLGFLAGLNLGLTSRRCRRHGVRKVCPACAPRETVYAAMAKGDPPTFPRWTSRLPRSHVQEFAARLGAGHERLVREWEAKPFRKCRPDTVLRR